MLREGTIVDASIISAPPSTKNKADEREPEMHQTKKDNQWLFGMKAHIGVDADSGLVHTLIGTAANTADGTQANDPLHGEETTAYGDAGYQGGDRRPAAKDTVVRTVALRPGKRRALPSTKLGQLLDELERAKAQMRAKGEHPFHVIKNLLGSRTKCNTI